MKLRYFQNEYGWGPGALSEIMISKKFRFHRVVTNMKLRHFQNEYGWGPRTLSEIMISKKLDLSLDQQKNER